MYVGQYVKVLFAQIYLESFLLSIIHYKVGLPNEGFVP